MATIEEINHFLDKEFPQATEMATIEYVGEMKATLRLKPSDEHLRPGGTISGPTMMTLADLALYVAVLGEIGIVPLAVTTSLNFNFLQRPAPDKDIITECKLLKVGRSLAVGEVAIFSEGNDMPIAHATGTYAIPSKRD